MFAWLFICVFVSVRVCMCVSFICLCVCLVVCLFGCLCVLRLVVSVCYNVSTLVSLFVRVCSIKCVCLWVCLSVFTCYYGLSFRIVVVSENRPFFFLSFLFWRFLAVLSLLLLRSWCVSCFPVVLSFFRSVVLVFVMVVFRSSAV